MSWWALCTSEESPKLDDFTFPLFAADLSLHALTKNIHANFKQLMEDHSVRPGQKRAVTWCVLLRVGKLSAEHAIIPYKLFFSHLLAFGFCGTT